ncbi:MAG: UTP--glucose-1-phosphate uridylyltransferase GalU [Dehalococcoidia bacterium]
MTRIRKAVIPAAGWGTRFLPTTKAIPKELLPLIDRPVIHYSVEEAVASGIEQVVVITSPGKEATEGYFSPSPELERYLKEKGKSELLEDIRRISAMAEMRYVVQEEQLGLGHAVLTAAEAVGQEPFAVLLPDDIIEAERPVLGQMIHLFERHKASILAVEKVAREQVPGYGIIEPEEVASGLYRVHGLVEKPQPDEAPSDLGIVGRYILTPAIFDALRATRPGALGEIQVTDGIANLLKKEPVYAYEFQGVRHDVGTPLGLIKASVAMALGRKDIGPELRRYLSRITEDKATDH